MKKRIIIITILVTLIIIIWNFNDIQMNLCLEIKVPILAKREKTELTKGDLFLYYYEYDR